VGANFVLYQAVVVDMERATGFAVQQAGSLSFFIDGKTFVVQQQFDAKAYEALLSYAQKVTGKQIP
jgi:hypothetical protein